MEYSDLYRDPITQKVIDLLDSSGPSKLKGKYINGDVLLPNESEFPMAYIARDTVLVTPASNMEDNHDISMVLTVILDIMQDLDGPHDLVQGMPELYEFCEARDGQFRLKNDTILYQLGKAQQLAPNLWIGVGSPLSINYGMGIERRGPGIFSVEANIRFNVKAHLPNPEFYE